jgi:flagellin-like protein
MKFLKKEDAVSPVIGVILMVAITVILAAVIAAFVFGMASGVSKTKAVAATARQLQSTVIVTWQGGQDNAMLTGYNVTVVPGDGSAIKLWNNTGNAVGNSTILTGGTTQMDHVTVVGVFNDGSQQVVLDTYV